MEPFLPFIMGLVFVFLLAYGYLKVYRSKHPVMQGKYGNYIKGAILLFVCLFLPMVALKSCMNEMIKHSHDYTPLPCLANCPTRPDLRCYLDLNHSGDHEGSKIVLGKTYIYRW